MRWRGWRMVMGGARAAEIRRALADLDPAHQQAEQAQRDRSRAMVRLMARIEALVEKLAELEKRGDGDGPDR